MRFYSASVTQRLLPRTAPTPQEYGTALLSLKSGHLAFVFQGKRCEGAAAVPQRQLLTGTVSAAELSNTCPQHPFLSSGP